MLRIITEQQHHDASRCCILLGIEQGDELFTLFHDTVRPLEGGAIRDADADEERIGSTTFTETAYIYSRSLRSAASNDEESA